MANDFSKVAVQDNGETLHCVFEHATDQVVNYFAEPKLADKYIKFLRKGGAFGGYTPTFITTSVKDFIKKNPNAEFERIVAA